MFKPRWKMNLQLFAEDTGVEIASAAGEQVSEVTESQTGVEVEAAAEPEKQNNFEKAFAKKLAAEREKWDSEVKTKYGDYDTHKAVSEYFQQANGMDALSLKERIELDHLQDMADQQQVPVEVLKRIQQLEEKAAKVDEFEQLQQEESRTKGYFDSLGKFLEGKEATPDQINQFMIDNSLTYDPDNMEKSFNIAYKAMMHDQLTSQLETAEKQGMKRLLQAKGSIPTIPGSSAQGQVTSPGPKTFAEARARAMARDFNT